MIDSNEEAIKSCNSVGEIRRVAAQNSLCEELLDSIEPVKVLLTKITERLQLKDKKFKVIQSASRELLAKDTTFCYDNSGICDPFPDKRSIYQSFVVTYDETQLLRLTILRWVLLLTEAAM
ncbi:hypothetical protein EMCRGX_G016231 [Ephydatia muelleri]